MIFTPILVLCIGLCIFIPFTVLYDKLLFKNNRALASLQFQTIFQTISSSITNEEVGKVLSSYTKTPCINLEQYRNTIRSISLDSGFYFVAKRVLDEDREKFENDISKIYNMTSFISDQLDPSQASPSRDVYWPVLYHPFDFGRGVDMFSNPNLKNAIEETLQTRAISYSLPINALDTGDISVLKIFPVENSIELIVGRFVKFKFLVEFNIDVDIFLENNNKYFRIVMVDEFDTKYLSYENGNKMTENHIFSINVKLSSTKFMLLEGFETINGMSGNLKITFYVMGSLISIICAFWEYIRARLHKKTLILATKSLEKSNEKGMFVANMSHEIRTPLNGILGMTDLIQQPISKENQYCVDVIKSCCTTLLNVVNTILDMASVESGNIELVESEVNIRSNLLEIVSDLWVSMFTKRSTLLEKINVFISKTVPQTILIDGGRTNQVITNLISNALKYTPSGEINVFLDVKKHVTKESKTPKIRVELKVRDSGVGLSKEQQEKLFTPFSRFHSETHVEGTGLGLCICKSISKAMNGDITCRSESGIGSEFMFYFVIDGILSYNYEEVTQEFNKGYIGTGIRKNSGTPPINVYRIKPDSNILVVDDIRVNRIVLKKHLENMGGKVFLAENGLHAVDLCSERIYDIIFMDSVMPIMNGIDATKLIRSNTINRLTPLIFLTADVMKESIQEYMQSGATGFMSKPFKIEKLVEILSTNSSCIEKINENEKVELTNIKLTEDELF